MLPRQAGVDQKYLSVRAYEINGLGQTLRMVKLQDITINVKFNLSQGKKKLNDIVNAYFSHQLRNPINSIMGMNLNLKALLN